MKTIPIQVGRSIEYLEDCQRIQRVLQRQNYDVDLATCQQLWRNYSDSMAAGWMNLPSGDNSLFAVLTPYIPS